MGETRAREESKITGQNQARRWMAVMKMATARLQEGGGDVSEQLNLACENASRSANGPWLGPSAANRDFHLVFARERRMIESFASTFITMIIHATSRSNPECRPVLNEHTSNKCDFYKSAADEPCSTAFQFSRLFALQRQFKPRSQQVTRPPAFPRY